jgi:hypothetical protein
MLELAYGLDLGKLTHPFQQRFKSAEIGLPDYLMRRFSITQYVLCSERAACRNEFCRSQQEYEEHNPNMIPSILYNRCCENSQILWIHIKNQWTVLGASVR